MIIDTHCHIDMYPNPIQVLNECEKRGITVISMTSLPSHFELGYNHFIGKNKIRQALGFHPLLICKYDANEILKFEKLINKTSYIGEIGLDFSREGINTKDLQIQIFTKILSIIENNTSRKILSLHSRKAEKDVLNLLVKHNIPNAIFHWYTGPLALIDKIIEAKYYFSINPSMIKSENGKKIISKIPLNRLLTESDGPYISINNSEIKPNDVRLVIEYLGKLHLKTCDEIENIIYSNFKRILLKLE